MTGTIRLNGAPVPLAQTVGELIARLDLPTEARGIAVAVNGAVVPRSTWAETMLKADDTVEVIRALSGG